MSTARLTCSRFAVRFASRPFNGLVIAVAVVASLCAATSARAQTVVTWAGTAGGGNGSWSTGNGSNDRANWLPNSQYVNGNNVVFTGTAGGNATTSTVTLGGAVTANNITISTTIPTFTISGAQTLTLSATAVGAIGLTRDALTTGVTTFSMTTLALGANQTWQLNGSGTMAVSAIVSGAFSLTKTGTGLLVVSGNNTFNGGLVVNAGTVRGTTSTGALGAGTLALGGGNLELANDTALNFARNTTVSTSGTIFSERLTAGAGVTHTLGALSIGAQTLTLGTDASVTSGTAGLTFGAVTLSAAGATFNANANTLLTLASVSGNTFGFTVGGAGNTSITGVIGTTTGGVTKNGTGTLTLGGANTFTGALSVNSGTLSIASINNGGVAGVTGASTNVASNLVLGGGSLQYTAATSGTTDRGFTLTAATTSTIDVATAGVNLTFTGSSAATSGALTKAGAGTLTLAGAQQYTGATTVAGGTLALGAANILSNSTAVTVNGAALNAGLFADTVASLTTSGNTTLLFTGSAAAIGSLTMGGLTFGAGTDTLNVNFSTAPTLSRYTLLTYTTRSGTFDSTSITGATGYRLVYGSTGAGSIDLAQNANQTFTATTGTTRALAGSTVTVTGTLANTALTGAADLTVSIAGSGPTFLGSTSSSGALVAGATNSLVTGTFTVQGTAGTQNWSLINTDSLATTTSATASGAFAVVDQRTFSVTSSTVALGRFLINSTPTGTTGVSSSGLNATTASGSLGSFGSLSGLSLTLTSGSANFVGAAASQTAGYTVSGSVTTAGAISGSISSSVTAEFGSISPVVVSLTGTAVNQRTFSSGTIALGFVHVGATGSAVTGSATVSSSGLLATTASGTLGTATGGPSGLTLSLTSGSAQFVGAASSQSTVYSTSGTLATVGSISGTYSIPVAAEFGSIAAVTIPVTGTVYSGSSTWATNGGGSWGTFAGTGTAAFGTNWGTNQGSPGLDTAFTTTDTATFGSALTGGTAAIYLDGANPSLKSLSFATAAGSYAIFPSNGGNGITLAATGTATVTVSSGTHDIHANLTLSSNTIFDVAAGNVLTLHTVVGGTGSLTKSGAGMLSLTGNNTYGGGTFITSGTIHLVSGVTPLSTGTVTLSGGSVLDVNFLPIANPIVIVSGTVLNPASGATFNVNGQSTFSSGSFTSGNITVNNGGSATFTNSLGGTGTNTGFTTVAAGGTATLLAGTGSAGTLVVAAGGTASVAGTVLGTLQVSGSGATTGALTVSGDMQGDLAVNAGGVVNFTGSNSSGSAFDVASGGLALVSGTIGGELHVSGTATVSGAVLANADVIVQPAGRVELVNGASFQQGNLTNDGTLVVNRSTGNDLTLPTAITGTGSLTKLGTGALTLTGSSSYSGGTTLSGGTLAIGAGGTTGSIAGNVANNASLVFNRSDALTYAGAISGTGSLTKLGNGTLTLTGSNTMSGGVTVSAGKLVVAGQFTQSNLSVAASATVSGTGTVNGTLSGNGTVEPGNSPGILTFADITASGSLSFAFEFTGTGSPTWSNAAASVNDVLRLTDTSTPFNTTFTASNVIDLYFDITGPLAIGDTFRGGFFTDKNADFIASVQNADFNFWVKPFAGQSATRTYNGVGYVSGDQYFAAPSTFQVASANFSGGTVSGGYVMQFVAVPEPSTWAMGMIGLVVVAAPQFLRRRARG